VAESLARLDAAVSWTTLQPHPDLQPGWVLCSDLLAGPERFRAWQQEVADAYAAGDDDGLLTGQGLVLDWYLAAITLPAAGVFHLDRRGLDLSPEQLRVRFGAGGSTLVATAVGSPGFTCLPDDPAATEPGATVVADPAALARSVRDAVVAHAERLVAAYSPTTRIGAHGLWGAVTDALDVGCMTGGWASGDMVRAAADARLLLGDGVTPLVGGSSLHEIDDSHGRRHWTRRRVSCCFLYRVPGVQACVTCPRVSDDERRRQAAGW